MKRKHGPGMKEGNLEINFTFTSLKPKLLNFYIFRDSFHNCLNFCSSLILVDKKSIKYSLNLFILVSFCFISALKSQPSETIVNLSTTDSTECRDCVETQVLKFKECHEARIDDTVLYNSCYNILMDAIEKCPCPKFNWSTEAEINTSNSLMNLQMEPSDELELASCSQVGCRKFMRNHLCRPWGQNGCSPHITNCRSVGCKMFQTYHVTSSNYWGNEGTKPHITSCTNIKCKFFQRYHVSERTWNGRDGVKPHVTSCNLVGCDYFMQHHVGPSYWNGRDGVKPHRT